MDTLTYWNGTWHEGNPAILGPRDHAFWLGSMVFDGGRAFEGCGPDLDLHAERVVRLVDRPHAPFEGGVARRGLVDALAGLQGGADVGEHVGRVDVVVDDEHA